ncbi:transporter [Xanthobacter sp. NFH-44]|uniref:transporter n=1 Tax=unclassified Xanthobacter TaxID=2623496 RepID=UPI00351CC6E4
MAFRQLALERRRASQGSVGRLLRGRDRKACVSSRGDGPLDGGDPARSCQRVAAVAAGATFNGTDDVTDYTTGTECHVVWAVMKAITKEFLPGVVGYYYDQITGAAARGWVISRGVSQLWVGCWPIISSSRERPRQGLSRD